MPHASTRLNVTLPAQLVQDLDAAVGPRRKSAFIARAVAESLERLMRQRLRKELEEGYAAAREQGAGLAREFEAADLEGWDEDY